MYLKLNPEGGLPLYIQIVREIKYLVACGALKVGDRLPSVRELASQLRINPNTVARAYRELQNEKLITSQWGEGSFISEMTAQVAEAEKKKFIDEAFNEIIQRALHLGFRKDEITHLLAERLEKLR